MGAWAQSSVSWVTRCSPPLDWSPVPKSSHLVWGRDLALKTRPCKSSRAVGGRGGPGKCQSRGCGRRGWEDAVGERGEDRSLWCLTATVDDSAVVGEGGKGGRWEGQVAGIILLKYMMPPRK